MPDITHVREPRLLALDQLLGRRSVGPLQDPRRKAPIST